MDSNPNISMPSSSVVNAAQALVQDIDLDNLEKIDFDKVTYMFEATGYKVCQDHTQFIFKVTTPSGVAFQICDRYSSIRSFYEVVKKYLGDDAKYLPKFPPKKMFGSKEVGFLI